MEWAEFCDQMSRLGEGLDDDGVAHLSNQVACWLTYALGHTDPAHPSFFRSSDPVYQWGGPNADQVARRARISGDGTYRISGHMGSCEDFILQIKQGATQSGGAGVGLEVSASSLGLRSGDRIRIELSAAEQPGTWLKLDPDAAFVHIRDYYFDWSPAEPATFVIERLDADVAPRAPLDVAAVLGEAAGEIEHSMSFWAGYQDRMLAGQAVNTFGEPAPAGRGVQDILYSHAGVSLPLGEALVVDLDPGDSARWDIQLYSRPWYEALDCASRVTSLNHVLAVPGPIVIAASDPGGVNWLDTEGRAQVVCTVRWWRSAVAPRISSRVVPLSDLTIEPVDRRDQIRRRESHLAWRYRT